MHMGDIQVRQPLLSLHFHNLVGCSLPSSWGPGLLIMQAGTSPTAPLAPEAGDASLQALEKAKGGGGRGKHTRLQGSTSTWSFQFKPSIGMTHGN